MSLGGLISTCIWCIGLATLTVGLRRLASFLHIYTLHSSTVQRYITDDDKAFALVTGASDGLGKELAKDLYERGVRPFLLLLIWSNNFSCSIRLHIAGPSFLTRSIILCYMAGILTSLTLFGRNFSRRHLQNMKSKFSSPMLSSIRAGISLLSRVSSSLPSSS